MQAVLDAPDPATRDGVRDRAMLHLAVCAGCFARRFGKSPTELGEEEIRSHQVLLPLPRIQAAGSPGACPPRAGDSVQENGSASGLPRAPPHPRSGALAPRRRRSRSARFRAIHATGARRYRSTPVGTLLPLSHAPPRASMQVASLDGAPPSNAPRTRNPHSARRQAAAQLPATSCPSAFWTPAVRACGED